MQTMEGVPNDQSDVYKTGGIWQCQIWENNNQNLRFSLSSMFAFVVVAAPVKTDASTSEKYGVLSN